MRLTPNQRMALTLERQAKQGPQEVCSESQSNLNNKNNETKSFQSFITGLWAEISKQYNELPRLLTLSQQELVWEQIISQSFVSNSQWTTLRTAPLAELAVSAWNLIQEWNIKENSYSLPDQELFQQWAKEYQTLCKEKNWIDTGDLLPCLMEAMDRYHIPWSSFLNENTLECCGFLEWTPAQQQFLADLEQRGVTLLHSSLIAQASEIEQAVVIEQEKSSTEIRSENVEKKSSVSCEASDPEQELFLAAAQIKQWFEANAQGNFAVVVPELTQRRPEVMRIFSQVLENIPFDVAAPIPLLDYPMIHSALSGLSLMNKDISMSTLGACLNSSYIGQAEELSSRAMLDYLLLERGETDYRFNRMIGLLEYLNKTLPQGGASNFISAFHALSSLRTETFSKRNTLQWMRLFDKMLQCLGWPGTRTLNSHEFQLKAQWDQLLNAYQQLDPILESHSFEVALLHVNRLARQILFLPQSTTAQIQILGLLEAVGLPFEGLWICGLHRDAWPQATNPNPFIPIEVQRKYHLPRSSPARELIIAKKITQAFEKAAPQVVFSFPSRIEDRKLLPSALIKNYTSYTAQALGLNPGNAFYQSLSKGSSKNLSLNSLNKREDNNREDNNRDWPWQHEATPAPGGTLALKLQSACPFRAFTELRLKAKPLPKPRLGLNEAERGEIIHQSLLIFWQGGEAVQSLFNDGPEPLKTSTCLLLAQELKELKNQDQLKALSASELENRLFLAIDVVLDHFQARYPRLLLSHYRALERNRNYHLLSQVIQLEKERSYFEIRAHEWQQEIELGGLKLKVRLDRIDLNETGEETIIDYKTGKVTLSDWFGERPADPQLPLYGITRSPAPATIAIQLIRPGQVKYVGLTEQQDPLPGLKTPAQSQRYGAEASMAAQYEAWNSSLTRLAQDFHAGAAKIDPREGEATCRQCSLLSVCRLKAKVELPLDC